MKRFIPLFIIALIANYSCSNKKGELPLVCDSTVHYSNNISQIIITNCMGSHGANCHSYGTSQSNLASYEGLKQQAEIGGKLWEKVVKDRSMPQGITLSETDISEINCWIHQGAPNN